MKERPILFSGPMVRAILDGRKTQTRRPMKPQLSGPQWDSRDFPKASGLPGFDCPFGQPGDRLWVRESWARAFRGVGGNAVEATIYRADDPATVGVRWRPSIHMPRWASRITLEITDVRVERLQEISIGDLWTEGFREHGGILSFRYLWDSDYGGNLAHGGSPEAWAQNPWVWVIEFKVINQKTQERETVG